MIAYITRDFYHPLIHEEGYVGALKVLNKSLIDIANTPCVYRDALVKVFESYRRDGLGGQTIELANNLLWKFW